MTAKLNSVVANYVVLWKRMQVCSLVPLYDSIVSSLSTAC